MRLYSLPRREGGYYTDSVYVGKFANYDENLYISKMQFAFHFFSECVKIRPGPETVADFSPCSEEKKKKIINFALVAGEKRLYLWHKWRAATVVASAKIRGAVTFCLAHSAQRKKIFFFSQLKAFGLVFVYFMKNRMY